MTLMHWLWVMGQEEIWTEYSVEKRPPFDFDFSKLRVAFKRLVCALNLNVVI